MRERKDFESDYPELSGDRRAGWFQNDLKYSDLKLSSATIRNEMSDLEELGYIIQPHTSAGRIPSDKGYRFYVDQLDS